MIREIRVVMRKELKEIGAEGGGGRRGRLTPLIGLLVAGIFFPVNFGVRFVRPETMLAMGLLLPLLFVLPIVADSFAGERERHTLETLLATRLPDQAILFGKLAAIVAYAFVLGVLALALGVITVNVAHPEARPLLIAAPTVGVTLAEIALVAMLMTGVGLLISLHATTVRQAQQRVSLVLLVPLVIPAIVRSLPADLKVRLAAAFTTGPLTPAGALLGLLAVGTVVVLALSVHRFRRSRLITG